MSLTAAEILNAYKQGERFPMQGTKPRFLVAMGAPNRAILIIQSEDIKRRIIEFLMAPLDSFRDLNGNTVLHLAINRGMDSIARLIIEDGANIEATNNWGSTPLHTSSLSLSSKCMELLLEYGANPHIKDNNNRSPMDLALNSMVPEIQDAALYAYLI